MTYKVYVKDSQRSKWRLVGSFGDLASAKRKRDSFSGHAYHAEIRPGSAAKKKNPVAKKTDWAKRTAALKKRVASATKRAAKMGINLDGSPLKKNPAKAIRLKNFTGTVRLNPNKTVSVVGRRKKAK